MHKKIVIKQYKAEYSDISDDFENINLVNTYKYDVNFDDTLNKIAYESIGELGVYQFPFIHGEKCPKQILEYYLKEGKVIWNTMYMNLTFREFCDQTNSNINSIDEICFVNPSERGGPEGDIPGILMEIYNHINTFIINNPFAFWILEVASALIGKAIFKDIVEYFRDISFEGGANYISIKKFVYSRNEWDIFDFAYKIDTNIEVASEILFLFGFEEIDSNIFKLRSKIDEID